MKVSVIVPVYNVEKYIEKCILSLVNQNFDDFEILIVNDETKDKSIGKIQYLIDQYQNIKLINRKNGGLSVARNTGLEHAIGKYVCFVDSDDWVQKDFLRNLYTAAEKYDADIVCSGYQKFYDDKSISSNITIARSGVLVDNELWNGEDALLYQLEHEEYFVEVWDDMYRREHLLVNNLYFEPGYLHEDEMFTPKALLTTNKVKFIDSTDYMYRQRENSIMSSPKGVIHAKSLNKVATELIEIISQLKNPKMKLLLAQKAVIFSYRGFYIDKNYSLHSKDTKEIIKILYKNRDFKNILRLKYPNILFKIQKIRKFRH